MTAGAAPSSQPASDAALPSSLTAWRDAVAVAWAAAPGAVVGRVTASLAVFLSEGVVFGAALRALIESIERGGSWVPWAAAVVVLAGVHSFAGDASDYTQRIVLVRTQQHIRQDAMAALSAPVGVAHLEDRRYADRVDQLMRSPERVSLLFSWLSAQLAATVGLLAGGALLAGLHPMLVVPIVAGLGFGALSARARRTQLEIMDAATTDQRRGDRLVALATAPASAFEIKMLGLGPWLLSTHGEARAAVLRHILRGEQRVALASVAGALLQALTLTAAMAGVVVLAVDGRIGAGDVAMAFIVLRSVVTRAGHVGGSWADLARNTFIARRYSWLARYARRSEAPPPAADVPERLTEGITLEDVSFAYPGQPRPVLEGVTLRLPAGTTVALVGDNGAGKSTIVKLLCRFYEPTAGRLTVDGVDLRDFDPAVWREALAGVQQDFARYDFLVRHAIGVGLVDRVEDEGAVAAAAHTAGASPFLDELSDRYGTQLGPSYGGAALSEGQWQKMAVARSMMRRTPLVVLLDEPTAALDPEAEHELFERYNDAAAASRERGGITLIVSHRLSTVRNADLIVVIDRGRVTETGSHAELLAAAGSYAEMFRLQASRYQ